MKATLSSYLSELKGKVGFFVAKRHPSGTVVTKISIPYSRSNGLPSTAQLAVREIYRAAIEKWDSLTEEEKNSYNELGGYINISGFNYLLANMGTSQTDVSGDATEATTWDASIVSLLNNLNRIRFAIVQITGEDFGTCARNLETIYADKTDRTAFTAWTPTITWGSHNPTVTSSVWLYRVIDDLVVVKGIVVCSDGNGVNSMSVSIPATAKTIASCKCYGGMLQRNGTTSRSIWPYVDQNAPGTTIVCSAPEGFNTCPAGSAMIVAVDISYIKAA
jgi:hypothetical protein